jgi:ribosomal protein S18 acetylase RimI-like enzyme
VAIAETGEIVGTVGCHVINGEEGHIRGMAVRAKCQGAGVATHLLNSVESALRDMKCTRISLDTTEPLQRAMQLYEKNGFCRSGKVSDFFGMNLFEYVVLKVEDPPDRAESQASHETHL